MQQFNSAEKGNMCTICIFYYNSASVTITVRLGYNVSPAKPGEDQRVTGQRIEFLVNMPQQKEFKEQTSPAWLLPPMPSLFVGDC